MDTNRYSIVLTAYEFSVLNKNYLISTLCEKQLRSATKHRDEVELLMTLDELEDLTGYVAAESNHARSKRLREEIGAICDYLEALINRIKRSA
jgi:hypothetical protein